jgi:magnesium chelatase family protein
MALAAKAAGAGAIVLPMANVREAQTAGLAVIGARRLADAIEAARELRAELPWSGPSTEAPTELDLSDMRAHVEAKGVLEQAAIDGGHVLMIGPSGCGKILLARRFPTILPPLTADQSLESSAIWSLTGLLRSNLPRILNCPFRAPHHTISVAGLVGGGSPARPGEVSLAHNGVLFLDELPEFSRLALGALREPLECGVVTRHSARGSWSLPARFQLIAAMSPCPCGERGRIAPLARFFKHRIEWSMMTTAELASGSSGETSAVVRARVEVARGQ